MGNIYPWIDAASKSKFQIDTSFSKCKILLVSPVEVEKASAKSSTSKRMCSAREVTDDDIFQAGEHYNILLFPKVALNTNLSSVGGNATTDPLVVKVSCVGNLVGAEYLTNIQGSKPFSGWCKGIF